MAQLLLLPAASDSLVGLLSDNHSPGRGELAQLLPHLAASDSLYRELLPPNHCESSTMLLTAAASSGWVGELAQLLLQPA